MADVVDLGYRPRPLQAELHKNMKRFSVLVLHRRAGKTVMCINHLIDRALRCEHQNPKYAYLAPLLSQAKRNAWDYLKQYALKIPGATVNETELRVDIPRPHMKDSARISIFGADNPDALRGIYLDGAVLDEYGDMFPEVWSKIIRPTLSDRNGWAIFIGTPKGQNHFYEIYQRAKQSKDKHWYARLARASETGIIPKSELDSLKEELTEEEFQQELECSFVLGITGAYYAKQLNDADQSGRIRDVPYDPALLVNTYWDLGIGDTTAIWFIQDRRGEEYRIIDYLEDSGRELAHYVKELQKKPYVFDKHTLPHDAEARELQTGKSRVEFLRELGLKGIQVVPKHAVDDGIAAVRRILPKCYFDKTKCERGINSLSNYQRKWDEKNKIFSSRPLHNWASHGSDAFRTFAMGHREVKVPSHLIHVNQTVAIQDYNVFNPPGGFQ